MKITRYLAIALTIVAILATVAWFLRNSIIQRISGPILAEYGLSITDVSLDALATENATISYLELEHENGTTFSIGELTLPIRTTTGASRLFRASRITIDIPETSDPEPVRLAKIVRQVLALPAAIANTEVQIAELVISPYPTFREVRWRTLELDQSLSATDLSIDIHATGESSHELKVALSNHSARLAVVTDESSITVNGESSIDLPSLTSMMPGLSSSSGTAELLLDGHIPRDETEAATFSATVTPSGPVRFSLSITPEDSMSVSLRSARALKLQASYPGNTWSVDAAQATFNMSYAQWKDISVSLANLQCSNGLDCSMELQLAMQHADLGFATAGRLELTAVQRLILDEDGSRFQVRPDATLSLRDLDVSETAIAALGGRLTSAASLTLSRSGWQMTAESLDVDITSLSLGKDLGFSAPLSLTNLLASDSDGHLSVSTALDSPYGELEFGLQRVSFPGFSGTVSLLDDDVVSKLASFGLYNEASIVARHNLGTDTGHMSVEDATLSFDVQMLSNRISPWKNDWNVRAGTLSFDLQIGWHKSADGWQLDGESRIDINRLAGFYGDTVFTGLTTTVSGAYRTTNGFTLQPASIQIGLLEVGLPIENISADYVLNLNDLSADVGSLRMHGFGGVVVADPFHYELKGAKNEIKLHARSLDLTELLTLKEFEAIELTGSIGAELPVVIEGSAISIVGGTLTGDTPGGVIRYQPDIVPGNAGTSAIGMVTEALSNFEYETLDSTVGYSKDGDLKLQMRIAGRNPDLKDNRPVILNLGVENNVPQMLRSLQAARAVEDILEKRIRK